MAGNPAPVVDASTGRVWLLFCRNNADGPESLICAGQGTANRLGDQQRRRRPESWAAPREITGDVKLPGVDLVRHRTGPRASACLRAAAYPVRPHRGSGLQPSDRPLPVARDPERRPWGELAAWRRSAVGHERVHGRSAGRWPRVSERAQLHWRVPAGLCGQPRRRRELRRVWVARRTDRPDLPGRRAVVWAATT